MAKQQISSIILSLHDGMEETGMFLFEIQLLNGFTVNVEQEEARNKGAKMVELEDGRVNVYFDKVSSARLNKIFVCQISSTKRTHD